MLGRLRFRVSMSRSCLCFGCRRGLRLGGILGGGGFSEPREHCSGVDDVCLI